MIVLFRKGNSHTFHGVECEMGRFKLSELDGKLKEGWRKNHLDLEEKEEPKKNIISDAISKRSKRVNAQSRHNK